MKKQLTEVKIIGFLGQAEASLPVKQLCLRHGFSEGIVNWLRLWCMAPDPYFGGHRQPAGPVAAASARSC